MWLTPRRGRWSWLVPYGLAWATLMAAGRGLAATDVLPVRNASFETADGWSVCQSIAGWTLYGAPVSSISIVEDGGEKTLRINRGKAFAYGLAIDPSVDYLLSVRVRARNAKVRIEAEPPLPDEPRPYEADATFGTRTFEFPLLAGSRPPGTREMWVSLGAEPTEPGGAGWFKSVTLKPIAGGPNVVRNPTFEEPVVQTSVPLEWSMDSGGATLETDADEVHDGDRSLKVSGVGRPVRISQAIDLTGLIERGVRRVRISGWGRSRGLGSDRVRLEVYGTAPVVGPVLSLSGDAAWMRGEVILDVERQRGRKLAVRIHAPRPFEGDAWFDDIRVEPVPDDEVVNLLANASFLPSLADPGLPDYWGLWGDAVWCIEPWSSDYFRIDDVPGPFPGARVVTVGHPDSRRFVPLPPNRRLNMFLLTGANLDLPKGDYTFSIYAKADQPNTTVHIHHPASESPLATARVGRSWQRIAATSSNVQLLPAIQVPEPGSRVWFSAPQLEVGRKVTAFRRSPGEGSVAPPGESSRHGAEERVRSGKDGDEGESLPIPPLSVYAEYDHVVDDDTVRARLQWTGTTPATVHWRLMDAVTGAKLPVEPQSVLLDRPGVHTFTIPTARLGGGAIGIQAVADAAGNRVGRASDVFAKLAGHAPDVRVSRFTRSVTVDGSPLLPVFLPVEPATLGDWHLDRLSKAGFNCLAAAPGKLTQRELIQGGVPPDKSAVIRRQLDRLQARGMKLLWPIPWSLEDWSRTGDLYGGKVAGLAATYRTLVSAFRDHPAILGWYLMDEPSPHTWEKEFGFSESDLHALWFAVKEADPGRPAYVNWNHTWAIAPYGGLDCTDVVGHDNYETSGEPFDYGALASSVRMINDVRAGRKPAFAWISGSYDELAIRPSADAIRVHAWLHLIYGTRGLGYWSKPPMDPRAWDEIKAINREAVFLHKHVFGNPESIMQAAGVHGDAIHHALWTVGDAALLIAVNTRDGRESLEIDVAAACGREVVSARRLFDDRDVQLADGVIRDECAPLSRYLYRCVLAPANPAGVR
jgi:hypothetical protein